MSVRFPAVILLLLVSSGAAAAVGALLWHLLPYEALGREDANQQFLLWEAALWMGGVALGLFGLAAWFGSTDLYARQGDTYMNRSPDHVARQVRQGVSGRMLFSDLPAAPWLMMGTGAMMVLQAVLARAAGWA